MPDEALPLDALIGKLFIERRDVKAIQKQGGVYNPVKSKFTRTDIQDHLSAKHTYGHYLIDPTTNNCRIFCFDIDLCDGYRQEFRSKDEERIGWLTAELRCFGQGLAAKIEELLEIDTVQVFSGNKGVHVYGLTGSIPAKTAREAAYGVLTSWDSTMKPKRGDQFWQLPAYPELEVEVFPKQDTVGEGYGNLLRLPLGVNQKSGRPSFIYDTTAPLWDFVPVDPLEALSEKT